MNTQPTKPRKIITIPVEKVEIGVGHIVCADDLSDDHRKLLSGNNEDLRFTDLEFTYEGERVPIHHASPLELRYFNLMGVNFRGQDIHHTIFSKCTFRSSNIGGSRLKNVRFIRCCTHRLLPALPHSNMYMIFAGDLEIVPITNKQFGPVFLVDKTFIICGCRCYTIPGAASHWVYGSQSGGPEFARKMVNYLLPRLTYEPTE